MSLVIIHLREHALISSLLFQFSFEWKKRTVAIIVPSLFLLSLLSSLPFFRLVSFRERNDGTKVIASSFEPIDRGNNESSMLGRFLPETRGRVDDGY